MRKRLLRAAAMLAAAAVLCQGCAVTAEDGAGRIEAYLEALAYLKPLPGSNPAPGSLAARVAASAAQGGVEDGFRQLGYMARVGALAAESGLRPGEELAGSFRDVAARLALPPAVKASAEEAALKAGAGGPAAVEAFKALDESIEEWLDECPDPDERQQAVLAVGAGGDGGSSGGIYTLFKSDKRALVRAACLASLGMLGAPESVEACEAGMNDPEDAVRREALVVVRRLRISSAMKAAAGLLRSQAEPVEVRREAAKALGAIGDMGVVPALVDSLSDSEDDSIRIQALNALRRITSQDFGLRASAWKKWWEGARQGGGA